MNTVIDVQHVTMKFNISKDRADSIKELVIRKLTGKRSKREELLALDDVSFSLQKGDTLGLVGLNGSGKSTMLKLISGILKPTSGTVRRVGAVSPLIELGAGFDADLTARENVFLNGAVLGFSHKQMLERYDQIIDYAELEDFQDMILKNYSSGMKARLGFSIATTIDPEILIVDEILGVGDFKFRRKSEKRILELLSGGTTVLMVSHSIEQIRTLCTRAIWLDHGRLLMDGSAEVVCSTYEEQA